MYFLTYNLINYNYQNRYKFLSNIKKENIKYLKEKFKNNENINDLNINNINFLILACKHTKIPFFLK
jgi:hypothetical protein